MGFQVDPWVVVVSSKPNMAECDLPLIVRLKNLLRLVYLVPRQLREDVGFQTCSIPCSRLLDMFELLSMSTKIELRGKEKLNY